MTRIERGLARPLARRVRSAFGLWPLYEARNRLLLAPQALAAHRWEDAEVDRLTSEVGSLPRALVAVVIPTYSRPELLLRAVSSALDQTVTDRVVAVVDDGGGLPDLPSRPDLLAVSLRRNCGISGLVRNVGIRMTESTFIAFLDDDNEWMPEHLEVALSRAEGNDVVYTSVERRWPDGEVADVLGRDFDRRAMIDGRNYLDINSFLVRRDPGVLFSRIPRARATLPKEDWEFIYRLSRTRRVEHVPVPTVHYLINAGSYYTDWGRWADRARGRATPPPGGGGSTRAGNVRGCPAPP